MQITEPGGEKAASSHLFAYTVEEFDAGNGQKAKSWTRIGVAFPHKEGPGLNVQLKSIPLNGHIVLLPPSDDDRGTAEADDSPPARAPEPSRGTQRRR